MKAGINNNCNLVITRHYWKLQVARICFLNDFCTNYFYNFGNWIVSKIFVCAGLNHSSSILRASKWFCLFLSFYIFPCLSLIILKKHNFILWDWIYLILNIYILGVLFEDSEVRCKDDQFQCLHLNLNQVKTNLTYPNLTYPTGILT